MSMCSSRVHEGEKQGDTTNEDGDDSDREMECNDVTIVESYYTH